MPSIVSPRILRRQRGVTAVESLIVVFVLAILIGVGAPSLHGQRERQELIGVAAQLETDVHLARSEAVARNRTVRLTLKEGGGASCYLIHEGTVPSCSCAEVERSACPVDGAVVRALVLPAGARVQLRSAVRSMVFDPLKGTVTPTATIKAESADGSALHQVVSITGRVRSCTPQGRVAGVAAC